MKHSGCQILWISILNQQQDINTDSSFTRLVPKATVEQRPDWVNIQCSPDYQVSFSVIDERILYGKPSGYATLSGIEKLLHEQKCVIEESFGDQSYVHVINLSDFSGLSLDGRSVYIKQMVNQKQTIGMIFIGASRLLILSIKLAHRLNIVKYPVALVDDDVSAIQTAREWLKIDRSRISSTDVSHEIIERCEWSESYDTCSIQYQILSGSILHITVVGLIQEHHIEPIFNLRKRVLEQSRFPKSGLDIVIDLGKTRASKKTRLAYIQALIGSHKAWPIRLLVFYGGSRFLQAAIYVSRNLVPFPVQMADDFVDALGQIKKFSRQKRKRRFGKKIENELMVETILEFLSGIDNRQNWESLRSPVEPDDPFYPVFEAISLIKHDLEEQIDERREAENRLKELLEEKEVLLKELHHRVKNNLQIISSLLSMQGEQIKLPEDRAVFDISRDRVRAMALVHEALYQTDSLVQMNFGEYIRNLIVQLQKVYSLDRTPVKFVYKMDSVYLDMSQSIACGLIVNEIVSNTLKHAFPANQDQEPRVKVALKKEGEGILLLIRDNGIGIPDSIRPEISQTLGLKLIALLVENQLKGRLEIVNENGTQFSILIPQNITN